MGVVGLALCHGQAVTALWRCWPCLVALQELAGQTPCPRERWQGVALKCLKGVKLGGIPVAFSCLEKAELKKEHLNIA